MIGKNIRGGFKGAGLVPFDPASVVSKLDVRLRTPTPVEEEAHQAQPWTPKTSKAVLEAQPQSEYLERQMRRHHSNSPESIIEAMKALAKALKATVHEVAILGAEVHDLRQSNESLSRRHKAKRTRLQNRGEMTIGEGRDLIDQMDLDTQVISS